MVEIPQLTTSSLQHSYHRLGPKWWPSTKLLMIHCLHNHIQHANSLAEKCSYTSIAVDYSDTHGAGLRVNWILWQERKIENKICMCGVEVSGGSKSLGFFVCCQSTDRVGGVGSTVSQSVAAGVVVCNSSNSRVQRGALLGQGGDIETPTESKGVVVAKISQRARHVVRALACHGCQVILHATGGFRQRENGEGASGSWLDRNLPHTQKEEQG